MDTTEIMFTNSGCRTIVTVGAQPTPEDVARVLIQLFPAGAGKSLLSAAQRKHVVLEALRQLDEAGV